MSEYNLPYILHAPCKRELGDPEDHMGYWSTRVKDINGKSYGKRHRQRYCEYYGYVLLEGEVVRHLCGNPWCLEVSHLIKGTIQDNNIDTVKQKGWYVDGIFFDANEVLRQALS